MKKKIKPKTLENPKNLISDDNWFFCDVYYNDVKTDDDIVDDVCRNDVVS